MGAAYDMPGKQVDGMDVLEVFEATLRGRRASARESRCPALLEVQTYRYKGHSMSDPARIPHPRRAREYRQQDPILILKNAPEGGRAADAAEEYEAMDEEAKATCDEAADFAERVREPPRALYEDV